MKKNSFIVKVAGGATAQCLGLMCAIYVRNRRHKEFKIKYFPYSTGTYWPFQINFLVENVEISDLNCGTKGLDELSNVEYGKVISGHPLSRKGPNYEKTLVFLRKLRIESTLQMVRGQRIIGGDEKVLDKVNRLTKTISGGFPPIIDRDVFEEMDIRFRKSGRMSPFSRSQGSKSKDYVVVHLRMGDKRSSFTNPADFGGDGIIDPAIFAEVLNEHPAFKSYEIFIVSDEPEVAKELLSTVGINAQLNPTKGDIWDDLYFISQSTLFIGSWSQVSQLAAACVINNGGKAFYPSTTHNNRKIAWSLEGLNFYEPKFLSRDHSIYG
jgi:hypothetical protein